MPMLALTAKCSTDCLDTNAAAHPSAVEVCDGIDNDCDGATNEGVGPLWYDDADGAPTDTQATSCSVSSWCTTSSGGGPSGHVDHTSTGRASSTMPALCLSPGCP